MRRTLWLVCACLLVAVRIAAATEHAVVADFDGDGKRDRASIDRHEPTKLRVRLSTTHSTVIVRNTTPIVGIAARDLDGDTRPELIVTGATSGLNVWTQRRNGLVPLRPQRTRSHGLSAPARHRAHDGPDGGTDAVTPAPLPSLALAATVHASAAARAVGTVMTRGPDVLQSTAALTPFSPRPPPASR